MYELGKILELLILVYGLEVLFGYSCMENMLHFDEANC